MSIAYVPTDLMALDVPNLRGGKIQKLASELVRNLKKKIDL